MLRYRWQHDGKDYDLEMVEVAGTRGRPYAFGVGVDTAEIAVRDFHIATLPVTQALWTHVTGSCPAVGSGADLPLENVSWDALHSSGGFLERLNKLRIIDKKFRLPTEAEWEYAARGGPHWRDEFRFSGSNAVDDVAWYDRRHGDWTMPVGLKQPNQLGLFDMSGNVWEWCEDVHTPNVDLIPRDGAAYRGAGDSRVLRGGCFHNWAIHCTVSKRYEIESRFHDGCIGFRLACD